MLELPPGPTFLLKRLPQLIIPPALVIFSVKLFQYVPQLGVDTTSIPLWAVVLLCFLSLPVSVVVRAKYLDWWNEREAKRLGAVLPPRVRDDTWWPEGIGLLRKSFSSIKLAYPSDTLAEYVQIYGNTLNFRTLFEDKFFTTEPEYIKIILATQFEAYDKGPIFHEQNKTVLGTGVFNADGELWKFHRAMTRPFFNKDRISHFDIFDKHCTTAISLIRTRLAQGFPVDIQDAASRFTMDSATSFLFGHDVHSLGVPLPYPHYSAESQSTEAVMALSSPATRFTQAFEEAQRLSSLRARKGMNWPLTEFWQDSVKKHIEVVHEFINPIMRAALEKKKGVQVSEKGEGEGMGVGLEDREVKDGETLLDHLINYTKDEVVLRDEILNIMLAGRDTTTNTITFAVYMLSQHPSVLSRLRAEVLEKVGESRRPTFEDVKEMKYLRAVINEVLRLYPAVPSNVRTNNKAVILPGKNGAPPFYIPANSRSPYSVFLMHRRKDLWGPTALEFDPDRFLDSRLKTYLTPNPFIFLPFNAGPRICLGQQFAYHETSFFLIRLLQSFKSITHDYEAQPEWSRPPESWKSEEGPKGRDGVRLKNFLTMSAMGGCWVRMEEAGEDD